MLCISAQPAHVQNTNHIWPDAYSPFKLDRRETKFLIFLLPPATSSNIEPGWMEETAAFGSSAGLCSQQSAQLYRMERAL